MLPPIERRAFTLIELVVLILVLVVLAGLLLPATRRARPAARRMACASNLRNLALAALNYEHTFRVLPGAGCGIYLENKSKGWDRMATGSEGRWSGLVALLPQLEQQELYDKIERGDLESESQSARWDCGPWGFDPTPRPGGRPYLDPRSLDYRPAYTQVPVLRCPADPGRPFSSGSNRLARSNYAFCFGDSLRGANSTSTTQIHTRGGFSLGMQFPLADILDGTANTIMMGEIATPEKAGSDTVKRMFQQRVQGHATDSVKWDADPMKGLDVEACSQSARGQKYTSSQGLYAFRGFGWLDARIAFTGFNTILPPNGASCAPSGIGDESEGGIFSAGSHHPGGCHIAMFDCGTRFIGDDIDSITRNSSSSKSSFDAPSRFEWNGEWKTTDNWKRPSPFGVWGAMGTREGGETMPLDD